MNNYRDLCILFHAWGLESSYFSTRICKMVKSYMEQCVEKDELLSQLPAPKDLYWSQAKREIEEAESIGIIYICILQDLYPASLLAIDDPPLVLFIMAKDGNLDVLNKERYSIVGTRKATEYGLKITKKISSALVSQGICIVSGLAHGIDSAAHRGTLNEQASTIAVLGSGLLEIFPKLNIGLAQEIIDMNGLVISEYGLRSRSQSYMFPRRNRIVTGLSKGVIIVEAELRSGSLISARLALEQGRDVYSVPGPIDVPTSIGTNKIISEGGQIIVSIESLLEIIIPIENRKNINFSEQKTLQKQIEIIKIPLSKQEERLVNLMSNNYYTFEELIELTNIEAGNLRQLLGVLTLKDVLKEIDGTYGR